MSTHNLPQSGPIQSLKVLAEKQDSKIADRTLPLDLRLTLLDRRRRYETAARMEREYRPFYDEASWEGDKVLPRTRMRLDGVTAAVLIEAAVLAFLLMGWGVYMGVSFVWHALMGAFGL